MIGIDESEKLSWKNDERKEIYLTFNFQFTI